MVEVDQQIKAQKKILSDGSNLTYHEMRTKIMQTQTGVIEAVRQSDVLRSYTGTVKVGRINTCIC